MRRRLIAGVVLLPLLGLSGTLAILLGLKTVSATTLAGFARAKGRARDQAPMK